MLHDLIDIGDYVPLEEGTDYNTVENAYETVVGVVEAHHTLQWVTGCVGNYRSRVEAETVIAATVETSTAEVCSGGREIIEHCSKAAE